MTRFCLTVHPIWGRVLARQSQTLSAAYADDAYLMGQIKPTLLALADTVINSFKQDADLEVCLPKCTIYMPGIPTERARQLIHECISENVSGTLTPQLLINSPLITTWGCPSRTSASSNTTHARVNASLSTNSETISK
jgi:hypothetical protein